MTILFLYQQQLITAMYTLTMIQIMKNLMMAQNCSLPCNFSDKLLMLNIGHQHHHTMSLHSCVVQHQKHLTRSLQGKYHLSCLPTQWKKPTSLKRTAYPNSIPFHPFPYKLSPTADTIK